MKFMQPIFLALFGCGYVTVANCIGTEAPVTVCDLADNVHKYRSHQVQVSGEVIGGLERLLLVDGSCQNKPISLSISNNVAKNPHVAPLWSAIYREGNIGTVGKHIRVTVSGAFGYEREWPGGILTVEDVHDLEVTLEPES
jgi:hypothetical protein